MHFNILYYAGLGETEDKYFLQGRGKKHVELSFTSSLYADSKRICETGIEDKSLRHTDKRVRMSDRWRKTGACPNLPIPGGWGGRSCTVCETTGSPEEQHQEAVLTFLSTRHSSLEGPLPEAAIGTGGYAQGQEPVNLDLAERILGWTANRSQDHKWTCQNCKCSVKGKPCRAQITIFSAV